MESLASEYTTLRRSTVLQVSYLLGAWKEGNFFLGQPVRAKRARKRWKPLSDWSRMWKGRLEGSSRDPCAHLFSTPQESV